MQNHGLVDYVSVNSERAISIPSPPALPVILPTVKILKFRTPEK